MNRSRDRRGFALPAAIGALVIVGVLVTAGFYMAQQEVRIGAASRFSAMAVNVAQSGVNNVLVNETSAMTALPIWGDTTVSDTATSGVTQVTITRVAQRIFFLDATSTVTEGGSLWGGATRRIGLVTRLTSADMDPPAALSTQGSLKVGGSSIVNGYDSIPSGWSGSCDGTTTNKPGLMIDDTTQITTSGGKFEVSGTPKIQQDTSITAASLLSFGDMSWDDLVSLAEKIYPSGTTTLNTMKPDSAISGTGYTCSTGLTTNWGDPKNATGVCGSYFPIIYAKGSLKLTGGYGQGILLIENDLDVQGGAEFFGPVFIKGELTTQGTGGHFVGGVVAANVNLGTSTVLGNALVSYSSCAVTRAILNNSALTKARPLAMRSWVDLSNVVGG